MFDIKKNVPLADLARPIELEKIFGQPSISSKSGIISSLLDNNFLPSLIFWGPPGTGKTTAARCIAKHFKMDFEEKSAVSCGVKDLRELLQSRHHSFILFLDEIHRFNKAQQDFLLPIIESGKIKLMGATTENPSFSLNSALLSRCQLVIFEALDEKNLKQILYSVLDFAKKNHWIHPLRELNDTVISSIAKLSFGDARKAINTLEIILHRCAKEISWIPSAEEISQLSKENFRLYDRDDSHYITISAFIKSMRASDPDASVYYLIRMIENGEDPLFVLRRMAIFASEDIGNAAPEALGLVVHAKNAFEFTGMPEGLLILTQTVIALASFPKSNSSLNAMKKAQKLVRIHGALPIPLHLRNADTSLMRQLEYGKDYHYPHDDSEFLKQDFLPETIKDETVYEPRNIGREEKIKLWLDERRKQRISSRKKNSDE